ncbi:metallophosphoesterase [Candidatus Woesearchaeota archaeon]|nr:metallophosphoesterase [Candidatus Woesearchaeota archaeon]
MLKVIYGTDFHGNITLFKKILQKAKQGNYKTIIYGGDICPRGMLGLEHSKEIQNEFLEKLVSLFSDFKKQNNIEIFLIMGNDDMRINYPILEKADTNGYIKLINKKCYILGKFSIIGYSYVPVTPFRLKDWEKYDDTSKQISSRACPLAQGIKTAETQEKYDNIEQDLQYLKKLSNPKKTIYVMHSPPYNTALDMMYSRTHVGSKSIKKFIEKNQPYMTLHGHIHESPMISGEYMQQIGKTISINPGSSFINLIKKDTIKIVTMDLEDLGTIKIEDL